MAAASRPPSAGHWVAAADVAARITLGHGLIRGRSGSPWRRSRTLVGTSLATQESVPAAFAVLALRRRRPVAGLQAGASVGGDCDTIAAMAGAVAGACCGVDALPVRANVEHLDLDGLADGCWTDVGGVRGVGVARPRPPAPRSPERRRRRGACAGARDHTPGPAVRRRSRR